MVFSYIKTVNGVITIYEKGITYRNRVRIKVNRIFRDLNGDPLTFYNLDTAKQFVDSRNSFVRLLKF